jgi:L-ascorbate metabolism protein UlaG (beta-lactamase superfamily)
MQIKWLGHASFLITSQDGKKIITDPYTVGNGINYKPITESAEIVTSSHGHGDHNNTKAINGSPAVLTEAGSQTVKGIEFKAVPVFHDASGGNQRGKNLIICFRVDGLNLCHLGDLGHQLNQQQLSGIGHVDILFIPIGGFFTIDAKEATEVAKSIQPKLVFPMHYKTSSVDYPIKGVEEFLKGKKNIRKVNSSQVEIKSDSLPQETEIVVLQPAH